MGPQRKHGDIWILQGNHRCLSALYSAGRNDELLALIAKSEYRHKSWHYRVWGAKSLAKMGKRAESIQYAEESRGLNEPGSAISEFCEGVLLSSGFIDEAYTRYAVQASFATTNLATFRAIAKKYPKKPPETILRDLVASQPGQEGKWFAAAKDIGLFELAIELVNKSATDPKTLIRAAKDYAEKQPAFAVAAGMAALRYLLRGYGYEITSGDVVDAYSAVMRAAAAAGIEVATMKADVRSLIAGIPQGSDFVQRILERHLAG